MINKINHKILKLSLIRRYAFTQKAIFLVIVLFYSFQGFAQTGNITISTATTSMGTWTYSSPNHTFVPSSVSAAVLNVTEITDRLKGINGKTAGNVIIGSSATSIITVSTDIIVGNTANSNALTFSSSSDINVNAQINTSSSGGNGGSISFTTTGGDVLLNINANLNASGTTTGGAISFTATNNGISVASNITTTGSAEANNGAVSITIGTSSAFTPFDGQITGIISAGSITKSGSGTLMFSGTNTYTGSTTISAGVLNIQNASALGTSAGATSVSSGAALEIQGGINISAEALTLNSSGISNGGALRSISGTNIWGGTIALGTTTEIAADANTLTINGIISGTNNLTKDGSGSLILGATNTYSGTTTIAAGTIKLTTGTNIPDASGLIFTSSNATLDLNGTSETLYYLSSSSGTPGIITNTNVSTSPITLTINQTNTGTPYTSYASIDGGTAVLSLTKNGAGSQSFRAASSYKGVTNINAGTLYVRHSNALGTTDGGTVVASGAVLQLNGVAIVGEDLTIYGTGLTTAPVGALSNISSASSWSGAIILASNASIGATSTLTIDGIISGSFTLTKVGTSTVELSGVNTFTGVTTISAGTLSILNDASLGTAVTTVVNTGAALQLNGVSVTAKTLTLNGTGLSSAGALISASGSSTWSGNITLASNSSISTSASLTLSGVISGAFTLTKIGSSTLNLSGANTYTGVTTISAGILNILNNAALGSTANGTTISASATLQLNGLTIGAEALTLSGGTLSNALSASTWAGTISLGTSTASTINTIFDLTLNGIMSGSGSITKSGSAILFYNVANSYTGSTTLSAGVLKLVVANAVPTSSAMIVNNATLDLNGFSTTLGSLAGTNNNGLVTSTQSGSITLTISGSSSTSYAGIIENGNASNFKLVKGGSSTLTLSGANTYNGLTNILTGGILNISNDAGLGATTAGTVVADGATLQLNGVAIVGEELTIYGNGVSSGGALSNITSASSWSGAIILASNASIGSASSTLTIDGIISGSFTLTKVGASVVELSGINTFTGVTTISAGTLSILNDASLGTAITTVVNTGAALQLNGVSITAKTLTLNGSGLSSAGALISASGSNTWSGNVSLATASTISTSAVLTLSGVLSGTGALTKIGTSTLNLTNTNTYNGSTTISAGVLNVTAPSSLGSTTQVTVSGSSGQLQISGGNEFTIPLIISSTVSTGALRSMRGNNTWSGRITLQAASGIGAETNSLLTISGIISGSFALTKYGTGNVDFNAVNTYTGNTTISAGILKLLVATAIPITNAITVDGTLDLNGISTTFASLADNGNGNGFVGSSISGDIILTISGSSSSSFAGIIQNGSATSLSIVKAGSSILTLSGPNTYTGSTSINAGAINVQDNSALGATSAGTSVANGAALQIQGQISIGAEAITIKGTGISNTGAIRNISSSNSIAGSIILEGDASIVSDASTLTLSAISGTFSLTIGGTGSVTNGGIINLGTGSLTKTGSGTVTLNAVNIFSGLTTISSGILKLGIIRAIPIANEVSIANGASLDLAGKAATLTTINGLGKITNSSGTTTDITISGTVTNTFAGVIEDGTGKLQLVKTGSNTLILTGTNTYTGNTTVTSGVLKLGASNVFSNSSNLYLNGGEFSTNGFTESLGSLNISNNSILRLDSTVVYSLTFASMGTVSAGRSVIIYGWRGFDLDKAVTKNGFVGNATSVGTLFTSDTKVFVKSTGGLQSIVNGGMTQYGQIVVAKPGNTGIKCTITINSTLNNTALNSIYFYSITDGKTYASTQLASKILISQ